MFDVYVKFQPLVCQLVCQNSAAAMRYETLSLPKDQWRRQRIRVRGAVRTKTTSKSPILVIHAIRRIAAPVPAIRIRDRFGIVRTDHLVNFH